METVELFLKEYEGLCKKYNLHLDSCGCCGSPFVEKGVESRQRTFKEMATDANAEKAAKDLKSGG